MKDKDTKILEEAYDTLNIPNLVQKYLFNIRQLLKVSVIRGEYFYINAHNEKLRNKLIQLSKKSEFKNIIDKKLRSLNLDDNVIYEPYENLSSADKIKIERIDFSAPML
jgi:predicted kinase